MPIFYFLNPPIINDYTNTAYFGLLVLIFFLCFYFASGSEDRSIVIPHLIKSGFFACFIALICFGGFALCINAIDFLIYKFKNVYSLISFVFCFSYTVIAFNIFLALVPQIKKGEAAQEKIVLPRAFKLIVLYVLFPIYFILLTILYLYFFKILITWKLPSGQLNWFVSWASACYIFFYFSLKEYKNLYTNFFYNAGHFLLIPCIAMQLWGVYIRVSAYGLTSARFAGILYLVSVVYFLITVIFVKKISPLSWFLFGAVLTAIASFSPLNLVDVPLKNQIARLEKILIEHGSLIYIDGKAQLNQVENPSAVFSNEIKQKITSAFDEIEGKQKAPAYFKNTVKDTFGFYPVYYFAESSDDIIIDNYVNDKLESIEVKDFAAIYFIQKDFYQSSDDKKMPDKLTFTVEGREYDITKYFFELSNYQEPNTTALIIEFDENSRLYISFLHGTYSPEKKSFTNYTFSGYFLKK